MTREIPRADWARFFDAFSRRHEGWLVTVEILGRLGAQVEARERRLEGIVAERESSGGIEILTSGAPDETLTHVVERPSAVRVQETGEGAEAAVQIESEGGETTLVRFRSAVLPEMVDGVASDR